MSKDTINLLPPELQEKEESFLEKLRKNSLPLVLVAMVIIIAFCSGTYFFKLKELERIKDELAQIAPVADEVARLEEEVKAIDAQNTALENTINAGFPLSNFLEALQNNLPPHLWLERVSLQNEGIVTIEGQSFFLEEIGAFADHLLYLPYLQEVKVISTTAEENGVLTFKIEGKTPYAKSENEGK